MPLFDAPRLRCLMRAAAPRHGATLFLRVFARAAPRPQRHMTPAPLFYYFSYKRRALFAVPYEVRARARKECAACAMPLPVRLARRARDDAATRAMRSARAAKMLRDERLRWRGKMRMSMRARRKPCHYSSLIMKALEMPCHQLFFPPTDQ